MQTTRPRSVLPETQSTREALARLRCGPRPAPLRARDAHSEGPDPPMATVRRRSPVPAISRSCVIGRLGPASGARAQRLRLLDRALVIELPLRGRVRALLSSTAPLVLHSQLLGPRPDHHQPRAIAHHRFWKTLRLAIVLRPANATRRQVATQRTAHQTVKTAYLGDSARPPHEGTRIAVSGRRSSQDHATNLGGGGTAPLPQEVKEVPPP